MVQGEKYGKHIAASCVDYGKDTDSKRSGFLALQKHVAAKKPSPVSKSSSGFNQNSDKAKNSNWGPFKDRNDFVNMHFC